jgi:hypothetical protein
MNPQHRDLARPPPHWTPDEALAVFEFVDMLRDQIWNLYGTDIQAALRAQTTPAHDPRQMALPILDGDQPF